MKDIGNITFAVTVRTPSYIFESVFNKNLWKVDSKLWQTRKSCSQIIISGVKIEVVISQTFPGFKTSSNKLYCFVEI